MWAAQFVRYEQPGTWINSGGLGTMGFAVPGGDGRQGGPARRARCGPIDGDGCFQMTNQELATCALNDIPIKVAVINNSSLGHGPAVADPVLRRALLQHRPAHRASTDGSRRIPDFVKLAEAYGCVGLRCESPEDVDATIEKAMAINDRPVVVDFVVHRDAMVWPMVPAGRQQRRHPGRPRHEPAVGPRRGGSTDEPAHAVRARGEQARRPDPRRGPVRPARLQHPLPRRRPDRALRRLADDRRGRRRRRCRWSR